MKRTHFRHVQIIATAAFLAMPLSAASATQQDFRKAVTLGLTPDDAQEEMRQLGCNVTDQKTSDGVEIMTCSGIETAGGEGVQAVITFVRDPKANTPLRAIRLVFR